MGRDERKAKRKEKREDRRENIKGFFKDTGSKIKDAGAKLFAGTEIKQPATGVFQKIEDVADTVWQGETDKEKEQRLEDEKETAEQTKQMVFDGVLYAGIGAVVLVGLFIVMKYNH